MVPDDHVQNQNEFQHSIRWSFQL